MNKLSQAGMLFAALLATSVAAANVAKEQKDAQAAYKSAVAKAKADHRKAVADCKKGSEGQRATCYKDARMAWAKARDAAADAYTNATGKPEPSPGE